MGNDTYIPTAILIKFEPPKPNRSGNISVLVLKLLMEAVKQPNCEYFLNILRHNV